MSHADKQCDRMRGYAQRIATRDPMGNLDLDAPESNLMQSEVYDLQF